MKSSPLPLIWSRKQVLVTSKGTWDTSADVREPRCYEDKGQVSMLINVEPCELGPWSLVRPLEQKQIWLSVHISCTGAIKGQVWMNIHINSYFSLPLWPRLLIVKKRYAEGPGMLLTLCTDCCIQRGQSSSSLGKSLCINPQVGIETML